MTQGQYLGCWLQSRVLHRTDYAPRTIDMHRTRIDNLGTRVWGAGRLPLSPLFKTEFSCGAHGRIGTIGGDFNVFSRMSVRGVSTFNTRCGQGELFFQPFFHERVDIF